MSLTSVERLKQYLGVPATTTNQDSFLSQLLGGVEGAFLRLIDADIQAKDYTSILAGKNNQILLLPEYPVISVTSVYLDDTAYWGTAPNAFSSDKLLVPGQDYALVADGRNGDAEVGRLYRINSVWPGRWVNTAGLLTPKMLPGAGNIKVIYRAGYETVPADIPLAIWQICAQLRAERQYGRPYMGEAYEEYSYSLAADIENCWRVGSAAQIVARYKRLKQRHDVFG